MPTAGLLIRFSDPTTPAGDISFLSPAAANGFVHEVIGRKIKAVRFPLPCSPAKTSRGGVYVPGDELGRWMEKAFTSQQFDSDPTAFRYLAWTNKPVADVNARVRCA